MRFMSYRNTQHPQQLCTAQHPQQLCTSQHPQQLCTAQQPYVGQQLYTGQQQDDLAIKIKQVFSNFDTNLKVKSKFKL